MNERVVERTTDAVEEFFRVLVVFTVAITLGAAVQVFAQHAPPAILVVVGLVAAYGALPRSTDEFVE